MLRRFIFALFAAANLMAWSSAMAIEQPRYSVVKTFEDFEIRRYEPTIVAQTVVDASLEEAGNEAFKLLAGYIFGKNRGERKIAMTAPVAQTPAKIALTAPLSRTATTGGMVVQFTMPAEWTLDTLPEPIDPRVELKQIPGRTVAVIRYSGFWSESRYNDYLAQLKVALAREGIPWEGEPVWARYNPPIMPWFLRRNEIWLNVAG